MLGKVYCTDFCYSYPALNMQFWLLFLLNLLHDLHGLMLLKPSTFNYYYYYHISQMKKNNNSILWGNKCSFIPRVLSVLLAIIPHRILLSCCFGFIGLKQLRRSGLCWCLPRCLWCVWKHLIAYCVKIFILFYSILFLHFKNLFNMNVFPKIDNNTMQIIIK